LPDLDEGWYEEANPDIGEAVAKKKGALGSRALSAGRRG